MSARGIWVLGGAVLLAVVAAAGLWMARSGEPASPAGGGPPLAAQPPAAEHSLGSCVVCGMEVRSADRWGVTLRLPTGPEQVFCSPRCSLAYRFRWRKPEEPAPASHVFHDYYDGSPVEAERVTFVVGSDVAGPMGPDFVPFASPARAAQFVATHGGKALPFQSIDAAVLGSVIGPPKG